VRAGQVEARVDELCGGQEALRQSKKYKGKGKNGRAAGREVSGFNCFCQQQLADIGKFLYNDGWIFFILFGKTTVTNLAF